MKKIIIATAIALLGCSAAFATADGCAVVLPTPDGFLALREAPSTRFKVLKRLRPGEHLLVDTATCATLGDLSVFAIMCPGPT